MKQKVRTGALNQRLSLSKPASISSACLSPEVKNVLLVEDDVVDVMAVQRLFRQFQMGSANYALHVAGNGLEALAMLRGPIMPRPRVILLDLNMPGMDGFEFLQALRADPELQHMRIIILTTSDRPEDKPRAFQANVAGYIIKPITLPQFVMAITTLNAY